MKTTKCIIILVISIIGFSLNQCKTEEILPGEINGEVYDNENSQPLQEATVILDPLNDTTITASDGKFLFNNLTPGLYAITVSKLAYEIETKRAEVTPGGTFTLIFLLKGAPIPKISDKNLDFGLDSTIRFFTISNIGRDTLKYSINANQNWITVFPFSGEVTDETDTLVVSINKTGLSNNIQKGKILISSVIGDEIQKDTVNVFVNGVMDRDLNYYEVVRIGTQTWMAENLNVGNMISGGIEQTNYQDIKKYCYNNDDRYCKIFGGLYQWPEMMQGAKSDSGNTGTTRGICPVGWHVPTIKEWNTLLSYLDETVAGIKLKEAGITHWKAGNVATNESGFTALPGGIWDGYIFDLITSHEYIWTATSGQTLGFSYAAKFEYNSEKVFLPEFRGNQATAVRCIMDPPKK
jgi:uncharacterized protein (TIGR02145 family)